MNLKSHTVINGEPFMGWVMNETGWCPVSVVGLVACDYYVFMQAIAHGMMLWKHQCPQANVCLYVLLQVLKSNGYVSREMRETI